MKQLCKKYIIFIISFLCIIVDQLIKILIDFNVELSSNNVIIKNFFKVTNVRNYGAAWSILMGSRIILILVAFIASYLIYKFLIKGQELTKIDKLLYGLLYGGILGNLIDRICRGYVIDYLDFNIFGYDFPVFNLADILIVISIFIIIIKIFRGDKNESNN